MATPDRLLVIVLSMLSMLVICEAEAQEPGRSGGSTERDEDPLCQVPVIRWPLSPGDRICSEWRCLTRPEWAGQVMQPERQLTRCTADLATERDLVVKLEAAHREAVADAIASRREADRMRRQRWAYVAAGVGAGVLLTAGVVYTGVQVVGAR